MVTTVLLADDSGIVRNAITRLLSDDPEIKLLAEADSFDQTVQLAARLHPQIVILDLHMCDNPVLPPSKVRSSLENARLLAISLANDDEAKSMANDFGAVALIDKMKLYEELIPAIKHYARNHDGV